MYPFEVSNFVGHKDINGDANNEKIGWFEVVRVI